MKTILSISGGVDSTYLLWKILTETTDEVTAINVDVNSITKQMKLKYDIRGFSYEEDIQNANKIQLIVDWLKANVRDFTFISEPINEVYLSRDINYPNSPPAYVTRYALDKINTNIADRICISNEWENDGLANGGTVGTTRSTGSIIAKDIFVKQATCGSIEFSLLDMDYNQSYALSELPTDLYNIIVSNEVQSNPKFLKRQWFKDRLAEGKTPKEIGDIAKARCLLSNGKWHSMKFWVNGIEPSDNNTWDIPKWPTSFTVSSN
jgi:hypothetical protein